MPFSKAKWIWCPSTNEVNEYADFFLPFKAKVKDKLSFSISSEADYVIYVNGVFLGFDQYPDFPDEKVYDTYDISSFLVDGDNKIEIVALSKNYTTSSHIAGGKGVIFELAKDGVPYISSSENTLSRLDPHYTSGPIFNITPQLGMSYAYSFANGNTSYGKSILTNLGRNFSIRPIDRLDISKTDEFKEIAPLLYGTDKEQVGYLHYDIDSPIEGAKLTISYGENLEEGHVKSVIDCRRFEVNFILKKGKNVFTGYFLRLGLRYLEISNPNVRVNYLGVVLANYLHKKFVYENSPVDKKVAEVSAYTLECCMHDHYEDCPWREQAQYTMDSRTQMLLGYKAFHEMKLPRSALLTMSHHFIGSGVLPITSPNDGTLSITNYSLIYPLLVKEYYENTGDLELVKEVYPNAKRVIEHYISKTIDGLVPTLDEWNFFEWTPGLSNSESIYFEKANSDRFALPNNAFYIIGLESLAYLGELLGLDVSSYKEKSTLAKKRSHALFYDPKCSLFYTYWDKGTLSVLAEYTEVMALYSEMASKEEKEGILKVLTSKDSHLLPLSLANYIFKYEVLLNNGGYDDYVVNEVNRVWGEMLSKGATTFWETSLGKADFGGAGSLCHGWSAVPLYVYFKLKEKH